MRKALFAALFLVGVASHVYSEELRPQYRAWKSSYIGGALESNVLFSTSPILFHMVQGSGTVNGSVLSYFSIMRATMTDFSGTLSTKAFIPLNQSPAETPLIGVPIDVFSDSNTYITKKGVANINILWDFYKFPPFDKFPKD